MFVVGGESLVDLVQQKRGPGDPLMMQAHAGGSPFNCAQALSKLGNDTGFLCPMSKDGFGDFLVQPLEAAGVKVLLQERVFAPTTLAVVTLNERGQAQYEFYRGAERALDEAYLLAALPDQLDVYQIGGFCAIEPTDAAIWLAVIKAAKARGAVISYDPNIRPSLVEDFAAFKLRLNQFLGEANLVKISVEDLEALDASKSVEVHAADLLSFPSVQLVVVTDGEHGSRAFTKSAKAQQGIYAPAEFGDTVGAGDSLMAGILSWLKEHGKLTDLAKLSTDDLNNMLRFGAVTAGINCGRKGCNPPTREEVLAAL